MLVVKNGYYTQVKRDKSINIKLAANELADLKMLAHRAGMNQSEFIRSLIGKEYLISAGQRRLEDAGQGGLNI